MSRTINRAEQLLVELYHAGSPFLKEYPWEFEDDRCAELFICSLIVSTGMEADLAREAVEILKQLGMTSIEGLASATTEQLAFINRVFVQQGCKAAVAENGTQVLVNLARAVQTTWNGYLQRFLRAHGQKMVTDLSAVLKKTGMESDTCTKVATLWLQNVANIPLLVPGDRHVQEFCKEHRLSVDALIETADRLGLNLAILDDLLALEASAAGEVAAPRRKQKKAVATAGSH